MYEELPHFHSRIRKTPLPRSESVEKSSQEDGDASSDHEVEVELILFPSFRALAQPYMKPWYNVSSVTVCMWIESHFAGHWYTYTLCVLDQLESLEPINQCLSDLAAKKVTTHQISETEAEENSSSCEQEDAASNSIK